MRDGFLLFSKDWIRFQKDFWILVFQRDDGSGFFFRTLDFGLVFQRDVDLVFLSDFGQLDGLTKEYGLVFRTLDWFFFSDIGTGFSIGLWIL